MADPTRGITCADTRRVVREALAGGWTWEGHTGTTHGAIKWPATGERLTFGFTPSVASWKSLATDVARISGVEVWRKGNRKRSRKADQLTGFSLDAAMREQRQRHASDVPPETLTRQHDDMVGEAEWLAASGTRADKAKFVSVLHRIQDVEETLRARGVAFDAFDPTVLAATDNAEPPRTLPVAIPTPTALARKENPMARPSYLTGAKIPWGRGEGSLSKSVLIGSDGHFWCATCDHHADTFGGVFGHLKSCPARPAKVKPVTTPKVAKVAKEDTALSLDLDNAIALLNSLRDRLPGDGGIDWKARALDAEDELTKLRASLAGLVA